ncbi:hypothetical protein K0A97_02920, partial [Patescibacteria group bacterium]|nr:hypothetical protein [Patescibacteria group bacterium]
YKISGNLTSSFILKNDLDFCDEKDYEDPDKSPGISDYCLAQGATSGWDPIGDTSSPFRGTFDGQNYTISNLFVYLPSTSEVGLFGYLDSAEISDLELTGFNLTGKINVGGMVGWNYKGILRRLSLDGGILYGNDSVGGLVGYMDGGAETHFSFVKNSSIVSDVGPVGGLIGYLGSGSSITNSYSQSSVEALSKDIARGGFVGSNDGGAINYSYSTGEVLPSSEDNGGGFAGLYNAGYATSNFYDSETSGWSTSAMGDNFTTSSMTSIDIFNESSWDIVSRRDWTSEIWFIDDGEDYPRLGREWTPIPIHYIYYIEDLYYVRNNSRDSYILNRSLDFCTSTHYSEDKIFPNISNLCLAQGATNGWVPIGNSSSPFQGIFNGRNYTITNLFINRSSTDYQGLFGYADSESDIKNLGLTEIDISGKNYVGGIVGKNLGLISNSSVEGNVSGNGSYIGGFVGENQGSISNSLFSSEAGGILGGGPNYLGGFVGYNYQGSITNSYSKCVKIHQDIIVIIPSGYSAGFVGYNYQGSITNSYSTGSVDYVGYTNPKDKGFVGGQNTGGSWGDSGNFFDMSTSGQISTTGNATGKTTTEMQNFSTFDNAGWDIELLWDYEGELWFLNEDLDYPKLFFEFEDDETSPTHTIGISNNTFSSNPTLFSIKWDDNILLQPYGQWIFSTNNSGTWANDSAVNFTETPEWANVTKTLNETPYTTIGYRWYATDTFDNPESTPIYSLYTYPVLNVGNGTLQNPYVVNTIEELYLINFYLSSYFILNRSLDFCDNDSYDYPASFPGVGDFCSVEGATEGWESLGDNSLPFQGVFDGQNYTLSNLYINRTSTSGVYQGLFGYADSGSQIKNLGIEDVNINSRGPVGSLIGSNYGTVSNSYAIGIVQIYTYGTYFGGLIGYNAGNISDSYTNVDLIKLIYTGGTYSGGLVGYNSQGSISNSYSLGDVKGGGTLSGWMGGLVGYNSQGSISNSYSQGSVNRTSGTFTNVAGFCGRNYQGSITNSYSTGPVYYYGGTDPTDKGFVGGQDTGGGWEDSENFFDMNTSNQTSTTGNATGKTTTEMQNFSTFDDAGWDIEYTENWINETWYIYNGFDYPRLWFEPDDFNPTYSNVNHNTTEINNSVLFSILWDDERALDPGGQWIFSTNNSGTWVNDAAVNFTGTPEWTNVTKTLNETSGTKVGYKWFASDNAGNLISTSTFVLSTIKTKSGLVPEDSGTPFYTNESNPVLINLSEGQSELITWWVNATGELNTTHEFFAFANLTSDSFFSDITDIWNVTIVENLPPNNPEVQIYSTDQSNRTNQNLICFSYISAPQINELDVTVKWFKNGTENLTLYYNNSYSSGTPFSSILSYQNTSKHDNWSCSMRIFDGYYYSEWGNSTNLTVLNSLPTVTLLSPVNGANTSRRTPTFSWSGTDLDDDTLTYQINITPVLSSLCFDEERYISDYSNTDYTPSSENYFKCLYDNNDYYKWKVRAYDGEDYGGWTSMWNINIVSSIDMTLLISGINFGILSPLDSNDTTDDIPEPIKIQNIGNALINITLQGTSLWESVEHPSDYFKFKAANRTNSSSFEFENSITTFTNVPSGIQSFLSKLNWITGNTVADVDFFIEAPLDEPPTITPRISNITFTASLAE